MLHLRLYKHKMIVFKDKATMKPTAQIFLSERAPLNYVDLSFDAIDDVVIHQETIPRNIEKIGGSDNESN